MLLVMLNTNYVVGENMGKFGAIRQYFTYQYTFLPT